MRQPTLILSLGGLLAILNCTLPESGTPGLATLSIGTVPSRTLASSGVATVASYQATLTQGAISVATTTSASSSLSFSGLTTGTYTLTVGAYNASSVLMAQAAQSVTLMTGTNSTTVTLDWVTGTGSFTYTATLADSLGITRLDYSYLGLSNPATTGSGTMALASASGTTTATLSDLSLASGDYSFTFRLWVGTTSVLGYGEVVQVLAGAPTTATRVLTPSDLSSPPPVPTLTATLVSGTATLTWGYSTGQVNTTTAYTLRRKRSTEVAYSDLGTPTAASYSWSDSTVLGGTLYQYRLVATNSYGSTTSAAVSLTTLGVTYDGNSPTGGTVPNDTLVYASGETVTVQANSGTLVRTGYTFSGWNTAADGTGTTYTAGSGTFTITTNTTLYAQWTVGQTVSVVLTNPDSYSLTLTGVPTQISTSSPALNLAAVTSGATPTSYQWSIAPAVALTNATTAAVGVAPSLLTPGVIYTLTLIEKIGDHWFSGTSAFTAYRASTAESLGLTYTVSGSTITDSQGLTYTISSSTCSVTSAPSASGEVVIPDSIAGYSVVAVANYGLAGKTGLTAVSIPASVTSLGSYAFKGCTALASVTLAYGVTSLGMQAFYNCTSLTSVNLPNSITSIGQEAFSGCTTLGSVTLAYGVTSVGYAAFSHCSSLTSVNLPNSITSIAGSTFYSCTSLTSITIPTRVTSIGPNAFQDCTGLTSVTIPTGVTSIADFCLLRLHRPDLAHPSQRPRNHHDFCLRRLHQPDLAHHPLLGDHDRGHGVQGLHFPSYDKSGGHHTSKPNLDDLHRVPGDHRLGPFGQPGDVQS